MSEGGLAALLGPPSGDGAMVLRPSYQQLRGRRFRLMTPASYVWPTSGRWSRLTVHAGFVTDMASVPRVVHPLIGPFDLREAAVFHDALYQTAGVLLPLAGWTHEWAEGRDGPDGPWRSQITAWTREEADRLFGRQMRELGVAGWRRRAAYKAVRAFAGGAWRVRVATTAIPLLTHVGLWP